jgi:hypothetical protein
VDLPLRLPSPLLTDSQVAALSDETAIPLLGMVFGIHPAAKDGRAIPLLGMLVLQGTSSASRSVKRQD